MKKFLSVILAMSCLLCILTGCEESGSHKDTRQTLETVSSLQEKQPTPTDLDFSLERYNLIRRAYWVNGQREKAAAVVCQVEKPLGYIILFTESGSVVGRFVVDGKVSSLNSFLTPDSEEYNASYSAWIADVDGSYGENDFGIFFFTPDGKYVEWTGTYLYSDIPYCKTCQHEKLAESDSPCDECLEHPVNWETNKPYCYKPIS